MFFFVQSTEEARLGEAEERAIKIIEFCDSESLIEIGDDQLAFYTSNTITGYQRIREFAKHLGNLTAKHVGDRVDRVRLVRNALVVLIGARSLGVKESAKKFNREEEFVSQFSMNVELIDEGLQVGTSDGHFTHYPFDLLCVHALDVVLESVEVMRLSLKTKAQAKARKNSDECHFKVIDAMGIFIEASRAMELAVHHHTVFYAENIIRDLGSKLSASEEGRIEAEKSVAEFRGNMDFQSMQDAVSAISDRNKNFARGRVSGNERQKKRAADNDARILQINSELLSSPHWARKTIAERADYIHKQIAKEGIRKVNGKLYTTGTIEKKITGKG